MLMIDLGSNSLFGNVRAEFCGVWRVTFYGLYGLWYFTFMLRCDLYLGIDLNE